MSLVAERLPDGHRWLRLADPAWDDPLDPGFAARLGGRWNPPGSFPVLYLNEDVVTARLNLRRFLEGLPYGPEDLRDDTAPVLVVATIPRNQVVADVHTPAGVAAAGLPATYPLDRRGRLVGHEVCRPVGLAARRAGLRGIRCRSARAPVGAGRELAWFPATAASRARALGRLAFGSWFWG
jgi:hypothetical protein